MIVSPNYIELQQSLKKQSWEDNTGETDFIITSISGSPGLWIAKYENSELVYYRITDELSEYISNKPKMLEVGSYNSIPFGFDEGISIVNGNIKNNIGYYGASIGCYTSSIPNQFMISISINYSSGSTSNVFLENETSIISFGFTENTNCDVYYVDTSATVFDLSSCKYPSLLIYSSGSSIEYTLYNGISQILTSSFNFDTMIVRLNPDYASMFTATMYFDFSYSAYQYFKTNKKMPNSDYSYFIWR